MSLPPVRSKVHNIVTLDNFFYKKNKTLSDSQNSLMANQSNQVGSDHEADGDDLALGTRFFVCPHCMLYFEGNDDFFYQHIDFCFK